MTVDLELLGLTPYKKLSKDLREAAKLIGRDEARFLVNAYYAMQENRKRSANQTNQLDKRELPSDLLDWLTSQNEGLEANIAKILDIYSLAQPIGARMRRVVGVGPVIAAGFLAHVDMDIATNPGKLQRFAGLDPTRKWEKGQKRPHNADLKVLCWKLGQSFLKLHNHDGCTYGHLYVKRKAYEVERNEAMKYADQAKQKLIDFKIGKDTEAYKYYSIGKLPPAHINQRALRWAVKLFLCHLHENWLQELKRPALKPWVIQFGGHSDYLPPDW